MEPNSRPVPGSAADIQARLLLWCKRADSGLARVEFTSERLRRRVIGGLRAALTKVGIQLHEVTLPTEMDPAKLVRNLIWRLEKLSAGVVSVDGFPAALPHDPQALAAALYVFNFSRERLAHPGQRQIWWMPPNFAEAFLRAVPDLDSWFLVKLRLADLEVSMPGVAARDEAGQMRALVDRSSPQDASVQAADLVERFERGIERGIPAVELVERLLDPALGLLRRAGLETRAAALADSFRPQLAEAEAARAARPVESPTDREAALARADSLYKQGRKLRDSQRFREAESLYRQALDLYEDVLGPNDPKAAMCLNNLAQLLQTTNQLAEAELLMRRALAIDTQNYGAEHPKVAIDISNLAGLLQATNQLAEAELLMRRALAIDTQNYGPEHPKVATDISNLAGLLQATNRLAEAELLMRRALAIDEKRYGPEHPKVAIDLNNLAKLLQDTKRLAEAERLMRRALVILSGFTRDTGHLHPYLVAALATYRGLLEETSLGKKEIVQRLDELAKAAGLDEEGYRQVLAQVMQQEG